MTPVYHDGAALIVGDNPPFPSGSLSAEIEGDKIWIRAANDFAVALLHFTLIGRLSGVAFADVAAAFAYLAAEFTKSPANLTRYEHIQSAALPTWTVNHNFGFWPASVSVQSPGGVEVDAGVTHITVNQLQIDFTAPYTGKAYIF